MLNQTVVQALNKQIGEEHYSSMYYLAMASWCDEKGLAGAARFLYGHADEERMHMLKLVHYVNDSGGHACVPAVELAPTNYDSLQDIFEQLMTHERKVTSMINELVALCWEQKDFTSFNFLQWYLAEQQEEESLFQGILDKLNMIGNDGSKLYWIDRELAEMTSSVHGGSEAAPE